MYDPASYAGLWQRAFWTTQAIEIPIYLLVFHLSPAFPKWSSQTQPLSFPLSWFCAFWASALTHPFVWYFFPRVLPGYFEAVAVSEAFAVLTEALWLAFCGVRRPLLWSFLANLASASFGFARHYLLS